MVDTPEDYTAMAQRIAFHVTPGEIKRSVQLLLRLGMLVRNHDGTFRQSNPLLSTGPGTTDVAAAQYHFDAIARAAEALQELPPEKREIVGMTVGVNRKAFEKIRKKMWDVRQEILAIADEQGAEEVYQVNMQLFSATR
jgi:uncharacterized protein (TIGR02147 family)